MENGTQEIGGRGQALPQADDLKSKYAAQAKHRQRHLRLRASACMACDPSHSLAFACSSEGSSSPDCRRGTAGSSLGRLRPWRRNPRHPRPGHVFSILGVLWDAVRRQATCLSDGPHHWVTKRDAEKSAKKLGHSPVEALLGHPGRSSRPGSEAPELSQDFRNSRSRA